jgi:acetyl-CoA carboxylase biotin carboxyl carrier protein
MDAQTLDYLAQLLRLADEERLGELRVEAEGVAIHICRRRSSPVPPPVEPRARPQAPPSKETRSDLIHIRSPLLGIFYRAPSPETEAYVHIGDVVEVDQTIGLVEAMKVFNEITSDVSGRVVELIAENGQLVHAGDALLALEPLG